MKKTINQELLNAAKCALLDLQGALEVERANDPFVTLDVEGVKLTIKELKIAIAKIVGIPTSHHTPGPWNLEAIKEYLGTHDSGIESGHPEALANAHLIAAAPELLAALKQIAAIGEAGVIERRETGKKTWYALDAVKTIACEAIAKAQKAHSPVSYLNVYHCFDCEVEWQTEGDSQHDDECPSCGTPYTPKKSEALVGIPTSKDSE